MSEPREIDWEALAHEFSSVQLQEGGGHTEFASRSLAVGAVESLIGAERLATAVDHYIAGRPGSELARSVLWLLHPWASMLRCREIYDSSHDIHARRSAVELLRVVADARVLPWVDDFLADPDPDIQGRSWMTANPFWPGLDCTPTLVFAMRLPKSSSLPALRQSDGRDAVLGFVWQRSTENALHPLTRS
jgi:hypothetical protein